MYQEWIDLSGNNLSVHWGKLGADVRGVIVKLTEGVRYEDPRAKAHCAGTRDAGRILGGYHYLRVRHGRPQDGRAQAHEFAERFTRERCEFGELDVETMLNESATSVEVREAVTEFIDELTAILNPPMLLYTSKGEWESQGPPPAPAWDLRDFVVPYPLSLAAYTAQLEPAPARPWKSWLLHQYTGSGSDPGVDGKVDRYRSRGSLDDFKAALGLPVAPLPNLADDPRVRS